MKFEIGLLKLAKMPTTVNIENILEKLDFLKKKSETLKKVPEPDTPMIDQSPSKPPLNLKEMQSYWIKLVEE